MSFLAITRSGYVTYLLCSMASFNTYSFTNLRFKNKCWWC